MQEKLQTVNITTDHIKLDQLLKFAGIAFTGGEAKLMIAEGLVKINGNTEFQRGKKVIKGDEVRIIVDEYIFIVKVD